MTFRPPADPEGGYIGDTGFLDAAPTVVIDAVMAIDLMAADYKGPCPSNASPEREAIESALILLERAVRILRGVYVTPPTYSDRTKPSTVVPTPAPRGDGDVLQDLDRIWS